VNAEPERRDGFVLRFLRWLAGKRYIGALAGLVVGFVDAYRAASPAERAGLRFWGFVGGVFGFWEIGAATAKIWLGRASSWPTLSTTVGHLETLRAEVGVIVVAVIVFAGFYAITYTRSVTIADAEPPREHADSWSAKFAWMVDLGSYTPPLVYLLYVLTTMPLVLLYSFGVVSLSQYQQGYLLYGALGLYGVLVPAVLYRLKKNWIKFPTLFATVDFLRTRFKRISIVVLAGLTILLVHLSLYPWPDLVRESNSYAGLTSERAREAAERKLAEFKTGVPFFFAAAIRAKDSSDHEIWLISFEHRDFLKTGPSGCVVSVSKRDGETNTTPSEKCAPS
jgi:hypothetical protein